MDELLCMIKLLIFRGPQHIINKSFKVQKYPLLLKTLTNSMCMLEVSDTNSYKFGHQTWKIYHGTQDD